MGKMVLTVLGMVAEMELGSSRPVSATESSGQNLRVMSARGANRRSIVSAVRDFLDEGIDASEIARRLKSGCNAETTFGLWFGRSAVTRLRPRSRKDA
jgi:translation initiation factor 1 (eIF-1/SUI1)